MSGSETSGEFELKVLIAVVGGSATGKKIPAVVEAACDGIAGIVLHRHTRTLKHPATGHALERSEWLQPEFDAHGAWGAIIADAKAACIHVYRNDDLIGGPRNLVDLSLEPIPFAINATAPDLFKAILRLNVLARFAHILTPGPESLTEITRELAKPPVANNQLIAAHREFAGDVASVLSSLFGGDHPAVPDRDSAVCDEWPAELAIAALNNRANLLLFKARTESLASDARWESIVQAKDGLAHARERAEATGASPYKLAMLRANYATAVSRLAALSPSDQAQGFIAEAVDVLRGCLSELPQEPSYDRPRIQILLHRANILASTARVHGVNAATDRILALREALKLFDDKQPGKQAEVRRELAAALLDRPRISRKASFSEAVPHLRAAATDYRDAVERAVWIDDKVYFMTNLVNTEIMLAQMTNKIDHISRAIEASSALKGILAAVGRDEECRKLAELNDRLVSESVRLEAPRS